MFENKIDRNERCKKLKKEGKWFSFSLLEYKISFAYVIYQYHKNGILIQMIYGLITTNSLLFM